MPTEDDDVDRLLSDLARWSAESLTTEEAGARTRQAWLRQQAADDTSLEALLIGWAERRARVRLTTVAGTVDQGAIVAVGRDFVLLGGNGHEGGGPGVKAVMVRTSAIASIGRAPERGHGPGSPPDHAGLTRFETAPSRRLSGGLDASDLPGWLDTDHEERALEVSPPTAPIDLAGALAGLVADRPRLRVSTGLNHGVVGELRWVGSDVACLALDGTPPAPAYVSLPSIIEVSILSS